jgi:UDP-N-acetylmuramoyl-L-alanyl-D-glutamate--2,6-diaminopimelate ligase
MTATLLSLSDAVDGTVVGDGSVEIRDVTHDSRDAGPGTMFVAVRGFISDGHDFVDAALSAGAAAVCVEDPGTAGAGPALVVGDARGALAPLSAAVHGNPSQALSLVGITGTNGKTTVAHLVEAIATAAGRTAARVGTVGARIAGEPVEVARTTPEATDFQRLLARMVAAGVEIAAVEVSSHALALGRVDSTRFAIGAFTNLSQDHLDFHSDMEGYFEAKALLFERCEHSVVWIDDPAGERIAARSAAPVTSVGLAADADVTGTVVEESFAGTVIDAADASGGARLALPLPGEFNVPNALVAAGIARTLGIGWDEIAAGIAAVPTVPGRFEVVPTAAPATVVVDYAHTPGGIEAAIAAARRLAPGRIVAVVGAGGDRDRAKRALMGAAAAAADEAIITSDNPRSEPPERIAAEVARGAAGRGSRVVVEVDRRRAIRRALTSAGPDDAVLVLGKGHEQGQEAAGTTIPFDDRTVAAEEAAALEGVAS